MRRRGKSELSSYNAKSYSSEFSSPSSSDASSSSSSDKIPSSTGISEVNIFGPDGFSRFNSSRGLEDATTEVYPSSRTSGEEGKSTKVVLTSSPSDSSDSGKG